MAGTEPEAGCLVTRERAGPLGLRLLASPPAALPVTWALVRRNCSCPRKSLPVSTQLSQEKPVSKCKLCPEICERYFGMKPRSLAVLQNLKYLASKLSTSACTYSHCHPRHTYAPQHGREDVLTFSRSANFSSDPTSR